MAVAYIVWGATEASLANNSYGGDLCLTLTFLSSPLSLLGSSIVH